MNRNNTLDCLITYINAARNAVIISVENDCFPMDDKVKLDGVAKYLDACVISLSLLKNKDDVELVPVSLDEVTNVRSVEELEREIIRQCGAGS